MTTTVSRVRTGSFDTLVHKTERRPGPAVVALHGSGAGVSAMANWSMLVPYLESSYYVVAPDVVGFGETVPPDGFEFGIETWVAWLDDLLAALDISAVHLIGNSFGGWLAMRYALVRQSAVTSMVLMGSGGVVMTKSPRRVENEAYVPSADSMRQMLGGFVYHKELITDELVQTRYRLSAAPGAHERFAKVKAARDRDVRSEPVVENGLDQLRTPTLLIHGKNDEIIPYRASVELLGVIPNAELVVFNRCGHWNMLEDPPRFNRLVEEFLVAVDAERDDVTV